ncbi:MAG: cysteine synthase family protein [Candidatus Dadabacteria bacterium]|nr:cysteine synthase family protein [Candidatus Dadabacteria bacterium]
MTPMLKLKTPVSEADIWVKLENMHGSGSSKERICAAIIADAESRGLLRAGLSTLVEATSGNTGIGLSYLCAARGYAAALFMPENVEAEKKAIARVYGAGVFETPADKGIFGAMSEAKRFVSEMPEARFLVDQFSNPLNPETHERETAREITGQMRGGIDAFVMGVGTGGTITGIGREITKQFPDAKIVAVEPDASAVLSGGKAGKHSISGIGAGFIPDVLDTGVYDSIVTVTDEEARRGTERLARENGLLAGPSSGANYIAAQKVARELGPSAQVVTIVCDSGDRYPAGG